MARPSRPVIPPAPRKTLIEWIEQDDGDTPIAAHPVCSPREQNMHARICTPATRGEPLQPPPGLALAPLG